MNNSLWDCLEVIPECSASVTEWRKYLGQNLELFRNRFLVTDVVSAQEWNTVKESELEPGRKEFEVVLRLDWGKLGAALCDAFGLNRRDRDLPIPGTRQIGSWSGGAVPVILTIQTDRNSFRHVICELALRLRAPFILFGPTSNHMDVSCHELLSNALARFFPLSDHVLMSEHEHGILRLRGSAAELFRPFTPSPNETLDEDSTIKAFAFVKTLDPKKTFRHPSPATVFSYYCIDGLSISAIARKCRCSRGTIINRLRFIHKHTGVDPKAMRRLSTSLGNEQLSDSRARYINRKRLIEDGEASEGEG